MRDHYIRQPRLRWFLCALLAATLIVTGCNDSDSDSNDDTTSDTPTESTNAAPTADAGDDQNVKLGTTVTLDGSASADDDGDTLTYAWVLAEAPNGSEADLSEANKAKPEFTADVDGTYKARLTVNDGKADSKPDTVTIVAARDNSAPVAKAGTNQQITTGSQVSLDGSASHDADDDTLTYAWAFTDRPSGSSANLSDADTVSPTFTPDIDGDYVVSLIVNDGRVDSAADTVTITSEEANSAPVADAGSDQEVVEGNQITLDGSASDDTNGDKLTYQWQFVSQPKGANTTLKGSDTVDPSFTPDVPGDYVVKLVVNDGQLDSKADNIAITVAKANAKPTADAGKDQKVTAGDTVELDASGSRDADNDKLTYDWTFVSKPKASSASLSDSTTVAPSFKPDVAGDYVLRLVVNDGQADSQPDQVTVVAAEANVAPTADAGDDDSVKTGVMVTLDGTGSADANGDSLAYEWHVVSTPKSSSTSLVNKTMAKPSFTPDVDGTYIFELVVNDGTVDSKTDRVQIKATTPNSAPVADAGKDQKTSTGEQVVLDGSGSKDADNDRLSYEWTFQSQPSDSQASLSSAQTASPKFTPDVGGNYVVNLQVNDGQAKSDVDSVRVEAVQPSIQIQTYDDFGLETGFNDPTDLPFGGNSNVNKRVVGSKPSSEKLGRFRLIAKDGDFTITNLQVKRLSGSVPNNLKPRFFGLSDGQKIRSGTPVPFSLQVNYVNVSQARVRFSFEIAETGDTFHYTYTITLR